jgi:hypothetical protein
MGFSLQCMPGHLEPSLGHIRLRGQGVQIENLQLPQYLLQVLLPNLCREESMLPTPFKIFQPVCQEISPLGKKVGNSVFFFHTG